MVIEAILASAIIHNESDRITWALDRLGPNIFCDSVFDALQYAKKNNNHLFDTYPKLNVVYTIMNEPALIDNKTLDFIEKIINTQIEYSITYPTILPYTHKNIVYFIKYLDRIYLQFNDDYIYDDNIIRALKIREDIMNYYIVKPIKEPSKPNTDCIII